MRLNLLRCVVYGQTVKTTVQSFVIILMWKSRFQTRNIQEIVLYTSPLKINISLNNCQHLSFISKDFVCLSTTKIVEIMEIVKILDPPFTFAKCKRNFHNYFLQSHFCCKVYPTAIVCVVHVLRRPMHGLLSDSPMNNLVIFKVNTNAAKSNLLSISIGL